MRHNERRRTVLFPEEKIKVQKHVQQEKNSKVVERITTLSNSQAVCNLAQNHTIQACNEFKNAETADPREREEEEKRKTQGETKKNAERDAESETRV